MKSLVLFTFLALSSASASAPVLNCQGDVEIGQGDSVIAFELSVERPRIDLFLPPSDGNALLVTVTRTLHSNMTDVEPRPVVLVDKAAGLLSHAADGTMTISFPGGSLSVRAGISRSLSGTLSLHGQPAVNMMCFQ